MSRSSSALFRLAVRAALVLTLAAGFLGVSGRAPSARAEGAEFVFTGRGYGHGVGMSQWGAWEAAREGKDFRFILGFYYPGTDLVPLDDPGLELTVKLSSEPWKDVSTITQNFTQVSLYAVGQPYTLFLAGPNGESSEPVPAGAWADVTLKNGKIHVFTTAGGHREGLDRVEARPAPGDRVKVQFRSGTAGPWAPREYWGALRVEPSPTAGFLAVFNLVPVEKYLRGIAEVPPDWAQAGAAMYYAPEAVKAQAVAARTYAVANKDPYLNDNQWDQVYAGYTGRSHPGEVPFEQKYPGIPQAAEQTAGLVLRYQGAIISSFFSSSSGGYTSAWDVGRYPYLPAKADPFSLKAPPSNPGYAWTFTVSQEELTAQVDGMTDVDGRAVHVGTVTRVEVASRDTSDPASHAATLRLTGDQGTAVVSASSFRRVFGYSRMRSTLILDITNPLAPPPPGGFSDVPPNHLYRDEIERAVAAGLMGGYPSGEFRPEEAVSRWQFAKIAVNLHNVLRPDDPIALEDVQSQPFWDVAVRPGVLGDESDWVAAAKRAGLVNGVTATNFRPYESVRRDQMASMLVRALGWEDAAAALPAQTPGFPDVPASSPHHAAATYLKSVGVLKGYEDPPASGTFLLRPEEPTKRMHVAVLLSRVLDLPRP